MGIREVLIGLLESASGPPGPPLSCDRCAGLTESPPEAIFFTGNVTVRVFLCTSCRVLQITDGGAFFDDGWQELRRRISGDNQAQ